MLESQGTCIGLSSMISASWSNALRGSSKERGIFFGWGFSYIDAISVKMEYNLNLNLINMCKLKNLVYGGFKSLY